MRPRFATFFDGRLAAELDALGVGCARLGAVRASRPLTALRARRRLFDLLAAERPDIAICHAPWTFGLAAPVLRRAHVPITLWVHDRMSGRPWVERWAALTRPDRVIANSHFTAASVGAVYPGVVPAVVYAPVPPPAPLDADARRRLRGSLAVNDDGTCVVLLASRCERWKGHAELLAAMAGVTGDWRVWIAGAPQKAGEDEYVRDLHALSASLGIDARVRFLGERPDARDLMQAADLHCQPNTAPEPFGLAFVEALYAARPVITTAMGGALEVVTPDCGVLVPTADTGALRDALSRLIQDAAARRQLGSAGPARAAALCDPQQQLRQVADVVGAVAA